MQVTQLNTAAGGINRQRTKGGAKPDNLFDLLNGYVDGSGAAVSRPGTREVFTLPPGTKGLCAHNGQLVVFAHQMIDGMPDGVRLEALIHPTNPATPLLEIHFAGPFLGPLYVTAEFDDAQVEDYWLQGSGNDAQRGWEADTVYRLHELIQPTVVNGWMYRAGRIGDPGPAWEPNVERKVGDVIEPTVPNGFEYVCVEVHGNPPRSGSVEPVWPTEEGAAVIEEADQSAPAPPPPAGPQLLPPDVSDRYGGGGGGSSDRTQPSMQEQ